MIHCLRRVPARGLVPRVAYTYDRLFNRNTPVRCSSSLLSLAHHHQRWLGLNQFVRGGGALIVLDDGRLEGAEVPPDYMNPFRY